MNVNKVLTKDYENKHPHTPRKNKPKQTQFHPPFRTLSNRTNPQLPEPIHPPRYTPYAITFTFHRDMNSEPRKHIAHLSLREPSRNFSLCILHFAFPPGCPGQTRLAVLFCHPAHADPVVLLRSISIGHKNRPANLLRINNANHEIIRGPGNDIGLSIPSPGFSRR